MGDARASRITPCESESERERERESARERERERARGLESETARQRERVGWQAHLAERLEADVRGDDEEVADRADDREGQVDRREHMELRRSRQQWRTA